MPAWTPSAASECTSPSKVVITNAPGENSWPITATNFILVYKQPKDTAGTIKEARRLWKKVNRPNLMVKIPATEEGIPAIEQCIADGLNINITLIFSLERYEAVMEAYIKGLERRAAARKKIDHIASVASFAIIASSRT